MGEGKSVPGQPTVLPNHLDQRRDRGIVGRAVGVARAIADSLVLDGQPMNGFQDTGTAGWGRWPSRVSQRSKPASQRRSI